MSDELEFKGMNMQLTESEKFALICGMLAGLRVGAISKEYKEKTVITLEPIPVGGSGCIGFKGEDVEYVDGTKDYKVYIITHDVDIDYSGYTLKYKYDPSKIGILSIEDGDIPIKYWDVDASNGIIEVQGLLDKGEFKKSECVLCYINVRVFKQPTKYEPIAVEALNSNGANPDYCTLLTYVKKEDDNWYLHYITPTSNSGFRIVSDKEKEVSKLTGETIENEGDEEKEPENAGIDFNYNWWNEIIMQDEEAGAVEGNKVIGVKGALALKINSAEVENFEFDRVEVSFITELDVDVDGYSIYNYGYERFKYCEYSYEIVDNIKVWTMSIYNPNCLSTTGGTVGVFFACDKNDTRGISMTSAKYINTSTGDELEATGSGGMLYYRGIEWYYMPGFPSGYGTGAGAYGTWVGGRLWSPYEQTVWVNCGGVYMPVKLKPGYNNIDVFIPDGYGPVTIESTGYILIPAGLVIKIRKKKKEDDVEWSSPHVVDRFEVRDICEQLLVSKPVPVDVDSLMDDIQIIDVNSNEIISTQEFISDIIDDIKFEDMSDIEILLPPIDVDNILDELDIIDVNENDIVTVNKSDGDIIDEISLIDETSIDIMEPPITDTDSIVNKIEIVDVSGVDNINYNVDNNNSVNEIGVVDIIDIEKG